MNRDHEDEMSPAADTWDPAGASEGEALVRLRSLFDQLPAAVCVLHGPDHVIEFANTWYRAFVGGREIEGRTVEEVVPEVREQGFIDLLDGVYRSGERFVGREVPIWVQRGGELVETFFDFVYEPVRGADGAVEGILAHGVEVTEAVRARQLLEEVQRRQAEDRFRQAIDSMIDSVIIGTPVRGDDGEVVDLVVEYVNPRQDELARRAPEELVGRRFTELWPNMVTSGLLGRYIDVVTTGSPLALDELTYDDSIDDEQVGSVFDIRANRLGEDLFLVFRDVSERVARDRALAESRARLAREHQAVLALQGAILPRQLPPIPGTDVAAEYVAASEDVEVGGDWFDVFVLPGGTVAVAVGDVAGKGIDAAQIMAQVRTAGRVAALAGQDAGAVLSSQNALMVAADLGPFATAVFALYQPTTGSLTWASAGHLPPLLVSGGRAEFLVGDGGPPLGVVDAPDFRSTHTIVAPGDRFVLYTDGLVERRTESIADGLERLRSLVPTGGSALATCGALLDLLGVRTGRGDDVCVLTLDRRADGCR